MIKFVPHPEIAVCKSEFDPAVHKTWYKYDYAKLFGRISAASEDERGHVSRSVFRALFRDDLWAILFFGMEIPPANHPWLVALCHEIESDGLQRTGTLDIWAREHFKAISINEPVPTPDGWVNHGDLAPGDLVYGPDGSPTKVLARTEVFTNADCYKIGFDDGCSIVCSGDHLWTVERKTRKRIKGVSNGREYREFATIPTKEIFKHQHAPDNRLAIRINSPLFNNKQALPIDPYVLGAWLGDGHSSCGRITVPEEEMVNNVTCCGYKMSAVNKSGSSTVYGISPLLRQLGLINNKRIPQIYQLGSIDQRLSLLQGLMDTDGTVDSRGTATFCNINEVLVGDFFELATGLGLKPSRRTHRTKVNGNNYTFYQVSFQAYKSCPVFRLKRKIDKCKDGTRKARRFIISCEPVESEPVSCIQVDRPDGLYLVGKHLVTTHNSTILTMGLTVKRILNDPECTTAIFSFKKPAADKFLMGIKETLEKPIMLECFPDVLYEKPETQSPSWSIQGGIRVKRGSASRKENTVEAFGLVEGMPTGGHFDHRIYDDVETADLCESPDQMGKCFSRFEMSDNLGTNGGTEMVIGTFYHHSGPLVKIRDKLNIHGAPMYRVNIKPATDNGQADGAPVLLSQERLDKLKTSIHFNTQQLCNPTPSADIRLDFSFLSPIDPSLLPPNRPKFVIIDPAGDASVQDRGKNDSWAMLCLSVEPKMDDLGTSNVFIEDAIVGEMALSEAVDAACQLYMRNGRINILGIEKTANDTTYEHIRNALRAKGRHLQLKKNDADAGNMILLKPAGRAKNRRIEAALQWPLYNSRIFYSTALNSHVLNMIRVEMEKFPFYHVDILDALAYLWDILQLPAYNFTVHSQRKSVDYSGIYL